MPAIRHQISIAAPVRTVWRALTTAEGIGSWWADVERLDGRTGGVIVLMTEDEEGNPVEERGIIHQLRPTRVFEVAWDKNSPAITKGTRVLFQVGRDGRETRIALVHSGAGVLDDDELRPTLADDWKRALRTLRRGLEGE